MMKPRNLSALLALGALTALPACSMFGGDSHGSSQYSQSTAPASYGTPATASAATGTSGTVAPVSAGMIRKVQTALQQNNDYRGHVDGVWGPMTESGVRKWQQAHNLTTTGEIDMATLQSMNISSDNQANAQSGQTNDNRPATPPISPAAIRPTAIRITTPARTIIRTAAPIATTTRCRRTRRIRRTRAPPAGRPTATTTRRRTPTPRTTPAPTRRTEDATWHVLGAVPRGHGCPHTPLTRRADQGLERLCSVRRNPLDPDQCHGASLWLSGPQRPVRLEMP